MGNLYRPRMFAQLTLPPKVEGGASLSLPLRVQSAELVQNDHTAADELRLTVDYADGGVDPRILASGNVSFWLANADDFGNWDLTEDNLRFMGRISRPGRKIGGDKASTVEIDCVDYTSFFLLAKPLRTTAIPSFSQKLDEAWRQLCEEVPGAAPLANNIIFQGVGSIPLVGDSVAARFRKQGKIVVQPADDAWAIWSRTVGALGLITYIYLDQCYVTTALDYYSSDDPPVFVYGKNILSLSEERHNDFDRRGVGITSFDPLTGTTLEAVYPDHGDARVQSRHVLAKPKKASKSKTSKVVKQKEQYDYFQVPGVTEQDALDLVARKIYEVRSRQEFQGTLTTSEMIIPTVSGNDTFDLLRLRSGDLIKIKIDEIDANGAKILESNPTFGQRKAYFIDKGFSEEFAKLLSGNLEELVSLRQEFYVKSVGTKFSSEDDGGTFEIEIHYCNKIVASGDTEKGTQA